MISLREEIAIPAPPEQVWPLLSDPAVVASCIPGAELTKAGEGDKYQGTMRVKFGPTVATFRGEAKLAYEHEARRCTIEGRGIDGRGASRANASGVVTATGTETTVLMVEGQFHVTGPLETFANAGGVHLARALLAEFAENLSKLVTAEAAPAAAEATAARRRDPVHVMENDSARSTRDASRPAAALPGNVILWRAFSSWLRHLFSGMRQTR